MRYLWAELYKQGRSASISGRHACRYSAIFLRFAITLQSEMKDKMYEILSKAFHLPSMRTLTDYYMPGAYNPDGVLCSLLESTSRAYKEEFLLKCQEDQQWL